MFPSTAELRPLASSRSLPDCAGPALSPEGRTRGFFMGGRDLPNTGEVTRMGGLFRAPKPAIVAAPQPEPAPPTPSPEQTGQEARAEARARAARGLAGTIVTSARGVLAPLPAPARKSLLGE